jgi:multidrug efflux pump subunit AcrB
LIRKSGLALVALLLFGVVALFFGTKLPSGFLPDEDQGYIYADYLNSQPVSHCSKSLCRCSTNASDHRKSRETVSTQFGRATFLENWSAIR